MAWLTIHNWVHCTHLVLSLSVTINPHYIFARHVMPLYIEFVFNSFQLGSLMRCPVTKFITHTISHICFLVLLAAATFRLEEKYVPIMNTGDFQSEKYAHLTLRERTDSLLRETLRPANTLITHVQICIMFWVMGEYDYCTLICQMSFALCVHWNNFSLQSVLKWIEDTKTSDHCVTTLRVSSTSHCNASQFHC